MRLQFGKKIVSFFFVLGFLFAENTNRQTSDSLHLFNSQQITHLSGHYILPLAIAYAGYGKSWKSTAKVMIASNLVDADHILSKPIYDPDRCSIGTHPLHSLPAISIYSAMLFNQKTQELGIGLLTHMAVDLVDCINTQDRLGTLNYPKYYRDPINTYSLSHLMFWYGISQFSEIESRHMFITSIGWELLEIQLPFKFAQESYLNKFCDVLFNSLGFYIGKRMLDN